MFFREVTPLIADPDTIRAARIYPGGHNLDRVFGAKPRPEPGWHYPEAWIFSPVAAINPGSSRSDEGLTRIYDQEGVSLPWHEFVSAYGAGVTGPRPLRIIVKMLDGSVTLPKEFHFRAEDIERLCSYESVRTFNGNITKPEVWIRYPDARSAAGPSYFGFRRQITPAELYDAWRAGVKELEGLMNEVTIEPSLGLYIPGGVVHSLGPGLYFEVLADGDLKITLQEAFAGRTLTRAEQLGLLYTGREDDVRRVLDFVDCSRYGEAVVRDAVCVPRPVGPSRHELLRNSFFEADWVTVPAHGSHVLRNERPPRPHILVAATGVGRVTSRQADIRIGPHGSTYEDFVTGAPCVGAIVHHETPQAEIVNEGANPLVLLHVREPWEEA